MCAMGLHFRRRRFSLFRCFFSWPGNKYGRIHFKNTHDSFLYASLVYLDKRKIAELWADLYKVSRQLSRLKRGPLVNSQRHLDLACEMQFLRECLEEVARLRAESVNLPGDAFPWMPLKKVA